MPFYLARDKTSSWSLRPCEGVLGSKSDLALKQLHSGGRRSPDKILVSYAGKEASGRCLFQQLHGVKLVGGSKFGRLTQLFGISFKSSVKSNISALPRTTNPAKANMERTA